MTRSASGEIRSKKFSRDRKVEIRVRGVSKDFHTEGRTITALADVNLTIPANRIFTLLGPSGCGKTTLLRCIVGLETPDRGEISIGDQIVWSREKNIFVPTEKRGLGMVFQTYAIWPHMTVFDNVAYPLETRKVPQDEIRARVEKVLRFVQLGGFETRPATKLSGGQQQRVALARALIAEPAVILFDEPLSNLDAKLREETRKELRSFLTELKITAVYVTHDRIEALSLSDQVAVMKEGRIIEIGTPRDIYFESGRRFVADFIGRANLIEGTVAALEGPRTLVDTAIGTVVCRTREGIKAGNPVSVCIRPEFIDLKAPETPDGVNLYRGRLESLLFIGEACEGEIRVGNVLFVARLDPTAGLREGDPVTIQFEPGHCSVLSA